MLEENARRLYVATAEGGRQLAISELPDSSLVVDDLTAERRLGEIQGDLTPFVTEIDSHPHIVFAGEVGEDSAKFVHIEVPDDELMAVVVREPVRHIGVWMTFPHPFQSGMTFTAVWKDKDQKELWRAKSNPLTADKLEPMFGPSWTPYAFTDPDEETS